MPSRGQQLGKLLNSSGDIAETSLPPKIETFSQSVSNTGKIEAAALGDDVSTIEQVSDTNSLSASGNTVGDQRVVGNALYIWNGSGWYRIALINESPTWDSGGQPFASYTLDADSPQDATVITLAASDPDGLSIQYSYVTGGSMDSMATISQDSSVFTITPKTVSEVGEGAELTGSITFRASDGVNILPSVSSFTLSFISIIQNSKYTVLLATAVNTSGSNNNITDESTNNHTITSYGNVHAGTFSPYRHGGYSAYFNGSQELRYQPYTGGDYSLGTSNFTMEAWAYATVEAFNAGSVIFSQRRVSNGGPQIRVVSGGTIQYFYFNGNNSQTSTATFPINQWNHVALVRSGTGADQTKVYLNGTEILSFQETANFNNTAADLTIGNFSLYTEPWYGYISDVRIVKDAVYTSDFSNSLPTEPLTAINNTIFLAPFNSNSSNYYFDDITGNGRVTANTGSTGVRAFSRHDNLEYTPADHGGSIYFDGSGDYLRADAALSSFTSSTSPFTIEAYVYPSTASLSSHYLFGINTSSSGTNNLLFNTHQIVTNHGGGGDTVTTLSSPITYNVWSHAALVSDGTTLKAFINGNEYASTTAPSTPLADCVLGIGTEFDAANGGTPGNYYTGYISDIRISDTALYTSAFTPTFSPLTTPSGTTLHIKGTDASIIDKAQANNMQIFGNVTGSTTQVKFDDTKSMYFDGTGDYIRINDTSLLRFRGTHDFTIEAWVYKTADDVMILSNQDGGTDNNYISFKTDGTNTTVQLRDANGQAFAYGAAVATNTWNHLAVSRSSGSVRVFVNGVSGTPVTITKDTPVRSTIIGGFLMTNYISYMTGYIQDLRITKGPARYTTDFTPPTKPLKG